MQYTRYAVFWCREICMHDSFQIWPSRLLLVTGVDSKFQDSPITSRTAVSLRDGLWSMMAVTLSTCTIRQLYWTVNKQAHDQGRQMYSGEELRRLSVFLWSTQTSDLLVYSFSRNSEPKLSTRKRRTQQPTEAHSMHALFSVCSLRDDNVITSKSRPTWKMKNADSILEYFKYFWQISSKSIHIISSYTVSKLGHFCDTVYNVM